MADTRLSVWCKASLDDHNPQKSGGGRGRTVRRDSPLPWKAARCILALSPLPRAGGALKFVGLFLTAPMVQDDAIQAKLRPKRSSSRKWFRHAPSPKVAVKRSVFCPVTFFCQDIQSRNVASSRLRASVRPRFITSGWSTADSNLFANMSMKEKVEV